MRTPMNRPDEEAQPEWGRLPDPEERRALRAAREQNKPKPLALPPLAGQVLKGTLMRRQGLIRNPSKETVAEFEAKKARHQAGLRTLLAITGG